MSEEQKEQTTKVVSWVLQTIYGATDTRLASGEVARNLLSQIRREEQLTQIMETVEFITRLMRITGGTTQEVFENVDCLLKDYHLDVRPIDELRAIVDYLGEYDVDWNKVRIDFGFGRGLQYYTGMIFEIHVESEALGPEQNSVCGGGRYDTLIADLGSARQVPALGFSFGLERLTLCAPDTGATPWLLDALVAPIGGATEFREGLRVAKRLRHQGLRVDMGGKGMVPRDLAGMAKRLRTKHALFLGQDEISGGFVSLRNMSTGKQVKCTVEEAIEIMRDGKTR
jgi:histidyl-tRNA synthetase